MGATELESSEPALDDHKSLTKIEGALPDIFYGALLPCVPVVLVSTLLLAVISTHQVYLDSGWQVLKASTAEDFYDVSFLNRALELIKTGGKAAYYVR